MDYCLKLLIHLNIKFRRKWIYLGNYNIKLFDMAKSKKTKVRIHEITDLKYKCNCQIDSEPKAEPNWELYRYWRDIQRTQLGASANLYMIFASAILGYAVNFLVAPCSNDKDVGASTLTTITISIAFLFVSLIFYGWFTHNRLNDFRETARLTKKGYTEDQIQEKTDDLGKRTWNLYHFQRYTLFVGFIFSLIGFSIYIFS